jgi:alpha-glucosidase
MSKPIKAVFVVLLGLTLCLQAAEHATSVPVAASGLVGDRIGLFVPEGLEANRLPPSLALVREPKIERPLPVGWAIKPVFTRNGNRFAASVSVPPDVDLYGGGEVTGPLRRNGQAIKLWNTDNYNYEKDGGRRLYQSHPWIMGVRADGSAFGVIFDSTWKADLACGKAICFTNEGPAFPVLVIDRESPQSVLRGLAELTGNIPLPPRWTLGYHQCRWSYHPDSKVREIASGFRQRRIPCDVIWLDIDYMDGFRIFTFGQKQFPDPKQLNADLHSQGFHSIWMIDPGVKADTNYFVYQSGQAKDAFVKTVDGLEYNGKVWPGPCAFPDFTRADVRAWWAGFYQNFMAQGIDGVWNDMNEPAVFDVPDWTMPEENQHRGDDGLPAGPHLQYHNVYGLLMTMASRQGIQAASPEKRPFVLTRANFLGGQRYAATWTGDNASTENHLRLSIPMSLTLGLSGQPFNGPDLGGFSGDATADLWARWIGMGVFFPFCRGHACAGTKDKEPWAFGATVEQTARIALERRYRLLPYLYTVFEESSRDGMPVMRPVFMADPKDKSLRSEEQSFLLGGDLLVLPRWAKDVKRPKGDWREFSLVSGDLADTNQAALRIRPGAIIPLGKVVQHTGEKSFAPLTLLVAPDSSGRAEGELYEDAGEGYGYRTGDFRRTTFRAETKNGKMTVVVAHVEGRRSPDWTNFVVLTPADSVANSGTGIRDVHIPELK